MKLKLQMMMARYGEGEFCDETAKLGKSFLLDTDLTLPQLRELVPGFFSQLRNGDKVSCYHGFLLVTSRTMSNASVFSLYLVNSTARTVHYVSSAKKKIYLLGQVSGLMHGSGLDGDVRFWVAVKTRRSKL